MSKIEFPKQLKRLLNEDGSNLYAPIRALADRVGEIVGDNKLPFFPDYTDHGAEHINRVLRSEVELVPETVWEDCEEDSNPRILGDADATVLIGGTLLHDIGMHLRPNGFLELISTDSRFQPLSWFSESSEGHSADRPWDEMWLNYEIEARRFDERTLGNIIGLEASRSWKFENLPKNVEKWDLNHHLVIGEFIRRHHARLAHEIAIHGFPGLPIGNAANAFPAMGQEEGHPLMGLADLIGLVARSHGISLRVCQEYIRTSPSYLGTPKPMGTAILYPMALLRVADYFQIDRLRAPPVLLQLRNPQSPVSVQEWRKHMAVQSISPSTDLRGKMVTISPKLPIELYLQLRDLLKGLQSELDHSTAVLDEAYGTRSDLGLDRLTLATRRVYSNLHSPAFRDSLPYVPERTGFTADPNLLTLLVQPLYGKQPGVGVRELMQNAVDAVCELEVWCEMHRRDKASLDLPEQEEDVCIEYVQRDDSSWFLRIRDAGIGMRSETIRNYFLRAGASFRQNTEWVKEFVDDKGCPRVLRAGRFGVGAFAIFLLGPSFRLWTRHASVVEDRGYSLSISHDSNLIEIRRVDGVPVGTKIEVDLSDEVVALLGLGEGRDDERAHVKRQVDWFCWDWPKIAQRISRAGKEVEVIEQRYVAPLRRGIPWPEWSVVRPKGFDAVYWTFDDWPPLTCNGLNIVEPLKIGHSHDFGCSNEAQLRSPRIAVFDSAANLPLTTQRYGLSQQVPFVEELTHDVILSFIAHSLVCGPKTPIGSVSSPRRHPLSPRHISSYSGDYEKPFAHGLLRWCTTRTAMVPVDPWLYSLLQTESCFIWGMWDSDFGQDEWRSRPPKSFFKIPDAKCAGLQWNAKFVFHGSNRGERVKKAESLPALFLSELVHNGVASLGHEVESSRVVVSVEPHFRFSLKSWQEIKGSDPTRSYLMKSQGEIFPTIPLDSLLAEWETHCSSRSRSIFERKGRLFDVLYLAEIRTMPKVQMPKSRIATVWNECLGARPIPFDPKERHALLDFARKHADLRDHISKWEEMEKMDSKWSQMRQ